MVKRIIVVCFLSLFIGSVAWADAAPPEDDDEGCSMVGTPSGPGAALLLLVVPAVIVGLRLRRR